jgi:heat shock protein HslJ
MLHSFLEEAGQHRRLITAWLMTAMIAFTWAGCSQAPHHTASHDPHMTQHQSGYRGHDQAGNRAPDPWQGSNQVVAGDWATATSDPASLRGSTWEWVHWTGGADNMAVVDPSSYTISFDGDGYARVRSDCNKAAGPSRIDEDGRISINLMRMTEMPCTPNSLSDRFTGLITRVSAWRVANGQLMLEVPRENGLLRFRRAS